MPGRDEPLDSARDVGRCAVGAEPRQVCRDLPIPRGEVRQLGRRERLEAARGRPGGERLELVPSLTLPCGELVGQATDRGAARSERSAPALQFQGMKREERLHRVVTRGAGAVRQHRGEAPGEIGGQARARIGGQILRAFCEPGQQAEFVLGERGRSEGRLGGRRRDT